MSGSKDKVVQIEDPACGRRLFDLVVGPSGQVKKILIRCHGSKKKKERDKKDCGIIGLSLKEIKKQLTKAGSIM